MRTITTCIVFSLLVTASALAQHKQCQKLVFGGTLSEGQSFRRNVGNGLTFRIDPWKDSMGWEFEIGPTSPKPKEWDQYIYPLTPPYRSGGAREVNTGWGVTAQNAVKQDRQFWFLLDRADAPAATAALDVVLWPKSEDEQQSALEKLASFPAGEGQFSILDSKVTPGTPVAGFSDCTAGHCGEIHWIRFEVTLVVPEIFTPTGDVKVIPAQCANQSDSPLAQLARRGSR